MGRFRPPPHCARSMWTRGLPRASRPLTAQLSRISKLSTTPSGVLHVEPIPDLFWPTRDPFLFCAHHEDTYPASESAKMTVPADRLAGRTIGNDFSRKDGFSMYGGKNGVPGFSEHPHTGLETLTFVRRGFVDHADSLGNAARFGEGDAQWITFGRGMNHSEMFGLLNSESENPVELFQLWINLPKAKKAAQPRFNVLWSEDQARLRLDEDRVRVDLLTGCLLGAVGGTPPPDSWGADAQADMVVATIDLRPGGKVTLPKTKHRDTLRTLYAYEGDLSGFTVNRSSIDKKKKREEPLARAMLHLDSRVDVELAYAPASEEADSAATLKLFLLQGKPLLEPVARRGPFVMNEPQELDAKYAEYRRTHFGGWPWPVLDPSHARDVGRFALLDGRTLRPPASPKR